MILLRVLSLLAVAVLSHGALALGASCKLEVSEELPLKDTNWIIEHRGYYCGFGVSSGQDVVAFNSESKEVKIIMSGSDIERARLSVDAAGDVVLTLANLSDVTFSAQDLSGHKTIAVFTPADKPEDRQIYKAWLHNQKDDTLRAWYCLNVLAKKPERERRRMDEFYAEDNYGASSTRTSYCGDVWH